jgi:hypothetical protein
MIVIWGFFFFFAGVYNCKKAADHFWLLREGIHTKAIISEIEKKITNGEDGEFITYWLHLDLPNYHGWSLGKKYEQQVDPNKYSIGEELEIIQKKDAPTEFLIKKELTFFNDPKIYLLLGFFLFFLSYQSCYGDH